MLEHYLILPEVNDRFSTNINRCGILFKCLNTLPKRYNKTYINYVYLYSFTD